MKTVTVAYNLCEFEELSEKAKQRAIMDHRDMLLRTMTVDDFIGAGDPEYGDTPESMYDEEYDLVLTDDDYVAESIIINNYLFFETGEYANTVTYCGNHPLAGKSFLKLNGMTVEF